MRLARQGHPGKFSPTRGKETGVRLPVAHHSDERPGQALSGRVNPVVPNRGQRKTQMMRTLLAAVLALGTMAMCQGEVKANGSGSFGIGIGLKFDFSGSKWGGHGCNSCLPIPNYSPWYPCPMPYGGLYNYNPYAFYPSYGSFPFGALPSHYGLPGHPPQGPTKPAPSKDAPAKSPSPK